MKNAYQKYKKTSIESASREKLLLLMYEGAIKYVKRAIIAVENNDIAERGMNIGYAFDIVLELNNTLDHEVGGEVAKNLEQLYMFITDQLTQANINADKKSLENALSVLETLYSGWKEAVEKLKRDNAATESK
jgi:flagellar protein FliS